MFENIGIAQIIVLAVVLLFLFGGKKLIDLTKGLGETKEELDKAEEKAQEIVDPEKKEETPWKSS